MQRTNVDPHVRAAGLAPGRDRELVLVGRQVVSQIRWTT
jgi:hypothetical protein